MPLNNTISTMNQASELLGSSWAGTAIYTLIFICLPIGLFAIGVAVLWNLSNYTKFKKYIGKFVDSFKYTLTGLITLVTLAIPFAVIKWFYSQAKLGNTVPIEYGIYIILGYLALTLLGWLVHKFIVKRVSKFEKEIKKEKEQ